MKKLTLVLISAIIFCFCFSACGKKDNHDYDAVIVNENYAYNSAFVCFDDSSTDFELAQFRFELITGTEIEDWFKDIKVSYSVKNSDETPIRHSVEFLDQGSGLSGKTDGYYSYTISMNVQVKKAETPQNEYLIFDNFEFEVKTNKTHNVKVENVKFYLDVYYVNERAFTKPQSILDCLSNNLPSFTAKKSVTINSLYTDGHYVKSAELLERKTDLLKDRQLDSFRANLEFIPEKFDMVCGYLIAEYTYYGDDNVMTAPIYNFYYKSNVVYETHDEIIANLPK